MADISTTFCGIKFVNPFVIAASPSSDSLEKVERAFLEGWGGAVLKTIEARGCQRELAEPNMGALDFAGKSRWLFSIMICALSRHWKSFAVRSVI